MAKGARKVKHIEGLLTADEFASLPESGMSKELVRGEVRRVSPPGPQHGSSTLRLASRLAVFVGDNGLGEVFAAETGFHIEFDPDTRTATVHRKGTPPRTLHEAEVLDGEDVVPGFRIEVSTLWA